MDNAQGWASKYISINMDQKEGVHIAVYIKIDRVSLHWIHINDHSKGPSKWLKGIEK